MAHGGDDWEEGYKRQVANLLGHLAAFVVGEFGDRCSTFDPDCPTCRLWKMHDELKEVINWCQ